MRQGKQTSSQRKKWPRGIDGVDFVHCRICGDRRRVISGRHLSKHRTDRETYMAEYDLSPDELIAKDFRRLRSSRRDFRPYSKTDWLQTIRAGHERNPRFFAGNFEAKHPQLYVQGLWLFGSWDDALRAAGFDPQQTRQRKSWKGESVVERIRALRQQSIPLSAHYAMKNHQGLFAAAKQQYGSWTDALIAAGLFKEGIPRKTRLGLLRDLLDLIEHSSKPIPTNLKLCLTHYFGSVRNAIAALKTDRKLLGGWSKTKITAILARMHRTKETLTYAAMRRESPALVSAAEAYFGSWGRALYAAGIDPNLHFVHHRWGPLP